MEKLFSQLLKSGCYTKWLVNEDPLLVQLEELGFDRKEAHVYLALSKRGESTAAMIAELTQIERTLVYYVIQKLLKRGLASYKIKNNVKYYSAAKPEKIKEELEKKTASFQSILPLLEKLQSQPFEGQAKVEVFVGIEGFKTVVNDMFKSDKEFLILGEEGHIQTNYPVLYKQYLHRLEKENVHEKVLVREDQKEKIWKSKNSEFRFISKNLSSPSTTSVYGNKVLITIWENPMFNIIIESSKIAESYRSYFQHFWEMAEK